MRNQVIEFHRFNEIARAQYYITCAQCDVCTDMMRRYFERTGCHIAKDANAGLDHQVALEQMTAEQRQAYAQDLRIPYDPDAEKVLYSGNCR